MVQPFQSWEQRLAVLSFRVGLKLTKFYSGKNKNKNKSTIHTEITHQNNFIINGFV